MNAIDNGGNRKYNDCFSAYLELTFKCIDRRHTHKGRKHSLQESNEKGQRSPSIDVTHRKVSIQPEDAELEVYIEFRLLLFYVHVSHQCYCYSDTRNSHKKR